MSIPKFTNCVRMQLDFVLEFDQLDSIPKEFWQYASTLVRGGVLALFPKEVIKQRFGDIRLVLGVDTVMTRMRPQAVEKRRRTFIRWVQALDEGPGVKGALLKSAEKVGMRGQEKEQGTVTRGRGRQHRAAGAHRQRKRAAKKRTR